MHIAVFLPTTLGAWAAVVAAIGGVLATVYGVRNKQKIAEVHVLVNQRLTDVTTQLTAVTQKLQVVTAERDQLDPARPDPSSGPPTGSEE